MHKQLSAVRVLEEIQAVGYGGGYSILKVYVRTIRPPRGRRPHLRFETEPGQQGQVDLSPYTVSLGEVPTAVVCFSFVLGFSRWQYICFFRHADAHAVSHGHVLAFEQAGGAPSEILYDRMKQVVLESYRDGVLFHPLFEKLAQHYGFRPVALAPGYKEGKGKVENPFKYVEGNFLAGRVFRDMGDLNAQAQRWLDERARVRVHRTTQERPIDRLDQERPRLIGLPPTRFVAALTASRLVGGDFCVPYETHRYSVPPRYVGRQATLYVLDGRLTVTVDGHDVASHQLDASRHGRTIAPEHEAEFREHCTRANVLDKQFQRIGPAAKDFAAGLRQSRGGAAGYHMQQILTLAERAGTTRVAEALRHALRYGAFDYRSVERIVGAKSADPLLPPGRPPPRVLPSNLPKYLRGAGPHQRSPGDYKKRKRGDDDQEGGDGQRGA